MNAITSFARMIISTPMAMAAATAQADVVTDWNIKANDFIAAAGMGPPPACRAMAATRALR